MRIGKRIGRFSYGVRVNWFTGLMVMLADLFHLGNTKKAKQAAQQANDKWWQEHDAYQAKQEWIAIQEWKNASNPQFKNQKAANQSLENFLADKQTAIMKEVIGEAYAVWEPYLEANPNLDCKQQIISYVEHGLRTKGYNMRNMDIVWETIASLS